jgi:hypothetical protein
MSRHLCSTLTNGKDWTHCCICDGRIHETGCTSRRDRHKDCCEARHKMLFDSGQTKGLSDTSFFMWSAEDLLGWHPNDKGKP